MWNILIVDDEPMIIEVLKAYFLNEGFNVFTANNGVEAINKFQNSHPDIIVLDLMLPDISGEEVCRLIRRFSDVPILMLTAKSSEKDKIEGIVMGADDYVTKPFSPKEVIVRVQAILRRTYKNRTANQLVFDDQQLKIDLDQKLVQFHGEEVSCTPIEFKLLTAMAKYPGKVFSRSELLEYIQEDGVYEGYERNIDTHIKNLRKKIEEDSRNPRYIQTVFGMGYKFGGNPNG